jgi:transposase
MDSAEAVHSYQALAQVERAFRSMKTIDLHIRPIHHHLADRVRAHIFLCMLAYYLLRGVAYAPGVARVAVC